MIIARDESAAGGYRYTPLFFRYQRIGAARSAQATLARIGEALGVVESVLDVGCGAGAWLVEHARLGVREVRGVEGAYVEPSTLLCPADWIVLQDLTQPFDLGRRFDMVQCLEVAEHVPAAASEILVDNLVRHGKRVLFSAAVPGQGGENHVNEQSYEYWRDLFSLRGYRLFDFVRPALSGIAAIESWYRYNMLFFVHNDEIAALPAAVRASRVPDGVAIRDYSSAAHRFRRAILKRIPGNVTSKLARIKHGMIVRFLPYSRDRD